MQAGKARRAAGVNGDDEYAPAPTEARLPGERTRTNWRSLLYHYNIDEMNPDGPDRIDNAKRRPVQGLAISGGGVPTNGPGPENPRRIPAEAAGIRSKQLYYNQRPGNKQDNAPGRTGRWPGVNDENV